MVFTGGLLGLLALSPVATLGTATSGSELEHFQFITCNSYPSEVQDYTGGEGKCAGLLDDGFANEDVFGGHHSPLEGAIDLESWDDPACGGETILEFSEIGAEVLSGEDGVACGETTTTGAGGFSLTSDSCQSASKAMKCMSGSQFDKCGMAKLTYTVEGQVVTQMAADGDGHAAMDIPEMVEWKQQACRSVCMRYTQKCCEDGFVGRSQSRDYSCYQDPDVECPSHSDLPYMCDEDDQPVMTYYDSAWVLDHIGGCDSYAEVSAVESFDYLDGTVTLEMDCYDPVCTSASTADEYCVPEQLVVVVEDDSGDPEVEGSAGASGSGNSSKSTNGLSDGAIAGIAAGSVGGLAILGSAMYFLVRGKNNKTQG